MDSFFARNRLSAYLDGALDDAEAASLSEAIERDPALKREYEAMRRSVDLLRREGPTEAPRGFHARVMESVRDEPLPTRPALRLRRWFARVPVEAMALAAAAVVVVIMIQGRPEVDEAGVAAERRSAASTAPLPGDISATSATPRAEAPSEAPVVGAAVEGAEGPIPLVSSADGVTFNTVPSGGTLGGTPVGARSSSGTGSGVEPYSPDWEQASEPEGGTPDGAPARDGSAAQAGGSTYLYSLRTDDPNALYTLSAVAKGRGGKVYDPRGAALAPFALSAEQDFIKVTVLVPAAEAASLRSTLTVLGASPTGSLRAQEGLPADQVGFQIEVGLQ